MKTWEYNLNSNVVYGSFDYGEVKANTQSEAIQLAKEAINKEIEEMNEVLNHSDGGQSLGVDVDNVEVTLKVEKFNLVDELHKYGEELDGDEINGLIFVGPQVKGGGWFLSFGVNAPNMKAVNIFVSPFAGVDGIHFQIGEDKKKLVPCLRPTSHEEFEEWKKFYIGQLVTVQGKFATVDIVKVDVVNKTYIVEGFLIPKQTITFNDFSDWGSLADWNGNPIVDCQIDLDEGLQFQYTDYNIDEEGDINLDDTATFGGGYIGRDYRTCDEIDLVSEVHPFTDRILDQFFIRYQQSNEDGDDETRINLDAIVRDVLK